MVEVFGIASHVGAVSMKGWAKFIKYPETVAAALCHG